MTESINILTKALESKEVEKTKLLMVKKSHEQEWARHYLEFRSAEANPGTGKRYTEKEVEAEVILVMKDYQERYNETILSYMKAEHNALIAEKIVDLEIALVKGGK